MAIIIDRFPYRSIPAVDTTAGKVVMEVVPWPSYIVVVACDIVIQVG